VTCGYCEHANPTDVARCEKCGRKLAGVGITIVPESFGSAYGNTAPQLQFRAEKNPKAEAEARSQKHEEEPSKAQPRQGNLFPVQEARRVIPFESISPEAASQVRTTVQRNAKARSHHRFAQRLGLESGLDALNALNAKDRLSEETQQKLGFPEEKRPVAKVEPVRYTNAPVALPAQRLMAASYDAAMIMIGVGLLVGIHHFSGAEFAGGSLHLGVYGGLVGIITLFYRLLWALGNGDSPGTKALGLRLLNFDGYAPTREQRLMRVFSSLISFAALGMGILWCLFDEERLTWHDEMSGTFPSPMMDE
jgi:uncharacterized RDD family membrane protein YckC